MYASHSPNHIHTPTAIGCHARHQPARQEQLTFGCLAEGRFDTPRVGLNWKPSEKSGLHSVTTISGVAETQRRIEINLFLISRSSEP